MFSSFGLNEDSFITANKSFKAYSRQSSLLNPTRIPEAFLLRTGAIAANTDKTISFAGIPFDFQLLSVWLWMPSANDSDALTATVLYSGVEQTQFVLTSTTVPWEPPFNILGSGHSLILRATRAITSVSLFLCQAKLLDVESV